MTVKKKNIQKIKNIIKYLKYKFVHAFWKHLEKSQIFFMHVAKMSLCQTQPYLTNIEKHCQNFSKKEFQREWNIFLFFKVF